MFGKTIACALIAAMAFGMWGLPTQVQAQRPRVTRNAQIYVKRYLVLVDKNGRKTWIGPSIFGPYSSRSAAQSAVDRLNSTEGRNPDGSRWYYSASIFMK
jgi:hypothetical protein